MNNLLRGLLVFVTILLVVECLFILFSYHRIYPKKKAVAIVRICGPIIRSRDIIKQLVSHQEDPNVQAVVLRIDSPGGGIAAVQEIYREIEKLREKKKKVIASIGTICTSGGYYLAVGGDEIFANPGSLVGNIGAIISVHNIAELLKKLGIGCDVIKSSRFKDMGSPFREMTWEERKILQGVIDDVHEQFMGVIIKRRGIDSERILFLADGRILTGQQAKAEGLVDRLGNLNDAIERAGEIAGIPGKPEVIEKRQVLPFLNFIFDEVRALLFEWGPDLVSL